MRDELSNAVYPSWPDSPPVLDKYDPSRRKAWDTWEQIWKRLEDGRWHLRKGLIKHVAWASSSSSTLVSEVLYHAVQEERLELEARRLGTINSNRKNLVPAAENWYRRPDLVSASLAEEVKVDQLNLILNLLSDAGFPLSAGREDISRYLRAQGPDYRASTALLDAVMDARRPPQPLVEAAAKAWRDAGPRLVGMTGGAQSGKGSPFGKGRAVLPRSQNWQGY